MTGVLFHSTNKISGRKLSDTHRHSSQNRPLLLVAVLRTMRTRGALENMNDMSYLLTQYRGTKLVDRIREVPGSNYGGDRDYLDRIFVIFLSS
jgi:hypothetical protein